MGFFWYLVLCCVALVLIGSGVHLMGAFLFGMFFARNESAFTFFKLPSFLFLVFF